MNMEFDNQEWCGKSVASDNVSACPEAFLCTNCSNTFASDNARIAQIFFICLISIVNVLTNVLLLFIIPRAEWLPRGTKQILMSLVYTDMGNGFLGLFSVAAAAKNRWPNELPEGICWLQGFFYLIFVDVSILNQALIPLDLVITQVRTTKTPRGFINILILLTWFLSGVSAGLREYITTKDEPYFFYNPRNYGCLGGLFNENKVYTMLRLVMMSIFIIIPLIVVVMTYSLLYAHRAYKIRRASSIIHPEPQSGNDPSSFRTSNGTLADFENGERISSDSRTNGSSNISAQPPPQHSSLSSKFIDLTLHTTAIKTTPWITLYFYCMLIPYFFHTVLHKYINSDLQHAHWIDFWAYWVLSLASTGNLFILLVVRSECRSQLKQLLKRGYSSIKQCRHRNRPSASETEEVRRQSRLLEFSQLYSQAIRSPVAGPSSR